MTKLRKWLVWVLDSPLPKLGTQERIRYCKAKRDEWEARRVEALDAELRKGS